jgi:hypothetical protein
MPYPRPDALLIPKVSWAQTDTGTAVSYGALVGTRDTIFLLPRSGSETAGFTLSLKWLRGGVTVEGLAQLLGDPAMPLAQVEAEIIRNLPAWQMRCTFSVPQLTRFEILHGWKLGLGVSAILQVASESPTSLRVPNKEHLKEMRQMYPDARK